MKRNYFVYGLLLCAGVVLGVLAVARLDLLSPTQSQDIPSPFSGKYRMEEAIINVADTVGDAVVSISTEHIQKSQGTKRFSYNAPFGRSPFGDSDPFQQFFEDFFQRLPQREYKQRALGSGLIIDSSGYILTNEHVVSGADKITVTLSDGREFPGVISGKDPRSDLAVIKIDARDLPRAVLGDSDNVRIGQWVVAIGNPFGFAVQNSEPTVTVGVVSALHRSLGRMLGQDKDYNDLIQTDAAINPGNSGGPLTNLKGEVIGINAAIFSTTGGYQGMGFAIPINKAKKIMSSLIAGEKILYGWLGVSIQDMNDDLANYFGLSGENGVVVVEVIDGSPAQKSGIKQGDIITRFAGTPIEDTRELVDLVTGLKVGSRAKAEIMRDKKTMTLEVKIAERPENLEQIASGGPVASDIEAWRGLRVDDVSSDIGRRFRLNEDQGVVIVAVEPDSPADKAGLVPGEVIHQINKQNITDISQYNKIIRSTKGDALITTSRGYFVVKE